MPFRFGIFGRLWNSRQRRTTEVREQESTGIALQVALATPSLSAQLLTPPCHSTMENERAGSSQSHSLVESRGNMVINDGQFNQVRGLIINVHQNMSGNDETEHINLAPTQLNHNRDQSQVSLQNPEITIQKSNDIYERHLTLKGRGFPLWIPEPSRSLHVDYRRTGVRIGDVGVITHDGGFSFLFNICLPHDDPVNPRLLPENFAPISPPIEATDIDEFSAFMNDSHLASASIKRSQTGATVSGIVFESSASEGAILTMPQGARSENLGNFARFREYAAANVAHWYKFVNGPRGREAKNGDVRLVVGFDKTTSWGMATFANQAQQNNCRLRFGPSEGMAPSTYSWEYSGSVEVKAGPNSVENNKLRRDGDPPDVQFENQCLFVRTLNVTLTGDVWTDIHSSLGSIHVDSQNSQYPHAKDYSDSNRPHSSNSGTGGGSNFQGLQSGTKRTAGSLHGLQDIDVVSDENPTMTISGPLQSLTAHPSKVLNDILLAKVPAAKMVITHDDDWSSVVTQHNTLLDPFQVIENILASRNVCEQNGVIFLEPKGIPNEMLEGSASVNSVQVSEVIMANLVDTQISFDQEVMERTHKVPSRKSNETSRDTDSKGKGRQKKPKDRSELAESDIVVPDVGYRAVCHLPHSRSQGDIPLYASTPAQEPTTESLHLPHSHSEGSIPLYPSILEQKPSVVDLPAQSDIIIAVIGPTGAGKSTFINKAAGIEATGVGHGLQSCTDRVQIVRCLDAYQNRRVVFVDTPGFNDSNISDFDILQLISDWLKVTYEKDIRLSGLLFFHRISDNRMDGSPLKYLRMFENLCGKDALKNVILVTTMWDEVEEEEGRNREKELSNNYWNSILELGCHTARFYNDTESAWDIVSHFQDARCTVLLQREMVDLGLELAETSAGRTLFSWLIELIRKIKELLAHIEAMLKKNQHSANRTVIERERTVLEANFLEADAQRQRYSSSVIRRFGMSRASTASRSRSHSRSHSHSRSPVTVTRANASLLSSSSIAESFYPPPPSLVDGTSEAYGRTTCNRYGPRPVF